MVTLLPHLLRRLPFFCGGRRQLAIENLALRQQLAVYKRTATRPRLRTRDRLFWVGLAGAWTKWRQPLVIVTPDTVLRWQGPASARTGPGSPAGRSGVARPSAPRSRPWLHAWPPRTLTYTPSVLNRRSGEKTLSCPGNKEQKEEEERRPSHGGQALADQRTEPPGTPGGSAPDCPGRQENGAEGSRETRPPAGRDNGNP